MSFKDNVKKGKFVITSEIGPPKGVDIDSIFTDVITLRGRIDAVNVTDLQSSVMRVGSMAICHMLLDHAIEPILQMTCRDRNRLALQSDLLSAHVLGIRNVLALTGDHPILGDHRDAKPVFDLDAITLLQTIEILNSGKDLSGNNLKGSPDLFAGAVCNPGADPIEPEIIKMEKKCDAGAMFFQTQPVYDMHVMERFLNLIKHLKVPVIAGVLLLKSAEMAKFMNKNIAGINVPEELIQRMSEAKDKKLVSVETAAENINALKPMVQGIHIMPLGWDKLVPSILDRVGIRG